MTEAREAIEALLEPSSVAVIGAGTDPTSPGGAMYRRLRPLSVPVWPVNPRLERIGDERCYPDVASLPSTPDLAVIATRADRVGPALEQCGRAGVKVALSIAGGFSEVGDEGRRLEDDLKRIVAETGVRLLGPNTLGVCAPHTGLDTIFVRHEEGIFLEPGDVAFVTQSGSVGVEALGTLAGSGTGLRLFLGLGNQADIDAVDVLDYLATDEGTRVTALYLESIPDGRRLMEALRAHESAGRPVVVLKVGRTDRGSKAAASHTGRLAGSAAIADGALAQAGAIRARDDEHLLDLSRALSFCTPSPCRAVAVVSAAGGYAVMGTDIVLEDGAVPALSMADFSDETRKKLAEACPPYGSVANPIDMTGVAHDAMYAQVLDALLGAPEVDSLVCFLSWGPHGLTEKTIEALERAARGPKPLVVHAMAGPRTGELVRDLTRRRIAAYPSMRRAVDALRGVAARGRR
ncbi:MAG: CoA-binding protein [Deltaproteobacteria bacterium]|nr:CoA-binding protein [Deltaproteobacteria bacterium]